MQQGFFDKVEKSVASIHGYSTLVPEIAIVTGTGLGSVLDEIEIEIEIAYGDIEGFPVSTAPSHAGKLILGRLHGYRVVALSGRFHAYEGWSDDELVLPIYVLKMLGADRLIVTNAAGGLNPNFSVPSVMLIEDHLSFLGVFPLAGPNDDRLGVRFPDMSRAYDLDMRHAALEIAEKADIKMETGTYIAWHGPALETNAERKFCRMAGGDAVGMSTVLEVVAANHAGIKVLGFSVIANAATGGDEQQVDTLEDILVGVDLVAGKIGYVIGQLLKEKRI
ncbi:MAG: purine-nucleoside phosphorylase [Alphaproteobacteria bacterium]|nr:purine-nucleoside phosphorylase [Alphaproteobacteria bacterium]